ncbi:PAS domain S-box protein [bacterium]|nr:PAS domain S-box protein [bacterium]
MTENQNKKVSEDSSHPFGESGDFFRIVFDNLSIGICLMDMKGQIIQANPYMSKMLGYGQQELVSKSYMELTHPEDTELTREKLELLLENQKDSIKFRKRYLNAYKQPIWVSIGAHLKRDDGGNPQYFISHITDISREKELEEQLRQAQKTEAIATLAGGIAHDFNNILSSVIGNAEFALRHELKEDDPATYSVRQIIKAANRASFLVKQIFSFSRRQKTKSSLVSINPIAKEIVKLLKATLPTNIQTRLILKANADTVMADPANIHQVLMNLCTNAAKAMQEKGGTLEIRIKNTEDSLTPPQIKISVTDTGKGMPEEIKERIFDPYFTTKTGEKGTGLGLPVVYGIVSDLQGKITVSSEPEKGSCFSVILPLHVAKPKKEFPYQSPPLSGGGEHILFVDDDEQIVEFMERSLEALGYQFTGNFGSIEAFNTFCLSPEQFDIVISDMDMNGYSGDVLAQKLLEIRSDIPIIICTGYDELLTEERAREIGIREVILKPFMIDEINEIIRRILDNP